jgi:hypothetical protein
VLGVWFCLCFRGWIFFFFFFFNFLNFIFKENGFVYESKYENNKTGYSALEKINFDEKIEKIYSTNNSQFVFLVSSYYFLFLIYFYFLFFYFFFLIF